MDSRNKSLRDKYDQTYADYREQLEQGKRRGSDSGGMRQLRGHRELSRVMFWMPMILLKKVHFLPKLEVKMYLI